jgi:integrase
VAKSGRTTSYNNIYKPELWNEVDERNKILLEDFIAAKETAGKSENTTKQYFSVLRLFFIWNLQHNQNKLFIEIKKKDLIRFVRYMMIDLRSSSNRIRTVRSIISSLGEYVENMSDEEPDWEGYRNIALKIEVPKIETVRDKTVLTTEEVERCLDKLVENGYNQIACYMALAIACGARKSELLRFKCEYINDEHLIENLGMYKTPKIKTKGKMLEKYIFKSQFQPYYNLWMDERKKKGIENEYIFITVDKDGKSKQADIHIADYWAQVISRYLDHPFYAHSLRHYWTTDLKKKGIPDSVIQALQGWSDVTMVSVYSDVDEAETFEKYFNPDGSTKNIKMATLGE